MIDTLVHDGFRLAPDQSEVSSELVNNQIIDGYDEITLWGVIPHMHSYGSTLTVEAWNAEDYACLVDVANWDFDWQGLYFYEDPVKVRGGDRIRIRCTWDTRGAPGEVVVGDSTEDEMCLAFFYATDGAPP